MSITWKQSANGFSSTGNQVAITLSSQPTRPDVLIAVVSSYNTNGASSVANISQERVGWGLRQQYTSGYVDIEIWLGVVSAGASPTAIITLNSAPTAGIRAIIMEYSGVSSQPDPTSNYNTNSGTTTNTGALTGTVNSNELVVGGVFVLGQSQTTPTTNSFSLYDGSADSYGNSLAALGNVTTISYNNYNSGTTISGGQTGTWYGCIVAFPASTTTEYSNATIDNMLSIKAGNQQPGNYPCWVDLFTTQGMDPILQTTQGFSAQDIEAYGFLGTSSDPWKATGGGAIMMGHGFASTTDEPKFILTDTLGDGSGAQATITGVNSHGAITSIAVTNSGSGYIFADVSVGGFGAILEANISNGQVGSITVLNGGQHYSSADTVLITGDGTQASATLSVSNGVITAVPITAHGQNYTWAQISVVSQYGSGARLAPVIVNGQIQSINIVPGYPGSSYTTSSPIYITNNSHSTLYLTQTDMATPAHLDLNNLTAHGNIILTGNAVEPSSDNISSVGTSTNYFQTMWTRNLIIGNKSAPNQPKYLTFSISDSGDQLNLTSASGGATIAPDPSKTTNLGLQTNPWTSYLLQRHNLHEF